MAGPLPHALEPPERRHEAMAYIHADQKRKEWAGLKELGVFLEDNHMEGYLHKPDRTHIQEKKPWEADIMEGIPSHHPKCKSLEEWDHVDMKFEVSGSIAYLTFNRPAANNSLNEGLTLALGDATHILKRRLDIRMVVLRAEGRMFCAGGDPKMFFQFTPKETAEETVEDDSEEPPAGPTIANTAKAPAQNKASNNAFARLLYDISLLPQFVVCCCQGSAMGGGVGLLCVSDMVIAVKAAQFVLSEVKLGLVAATISPYVVAKVGANNAKRIFCTAMNLPAAKAKEAGLVQVIINDSSEFALEIQKAAQHLQNYAPNSVAITKRAISFLNFQQTSESLIQWTAQEYARARKSEEGEAGVAAACNKKRPPWVV